MCVRARPRRLFYQLRIRSRVCGEPFFRAAEFVVHQRKFQPERDWLGMHTVAAPDHRGHFEPPRLLRDHRFRRDFEIVAKRSSHDSFQLHQASVVSKMSGRGKPLVNPARLARPLTDSASVF